MKDITESEYKDNPNYALFIKQKMLLELFLEKGAITQEQYNKSFFDMKEKMGF